MEIVPNIEIINRELKVTVPYIMAVVPPGKTIKPGDPISWTMERYLIWRPEIKN